MLVFTAISLCHLEAIRLSECDLIDSRDFSSLFKLIDSLNRIEIPESFKHLRVDKSFINNFKKENSILTRFKYNTLS